MNPNSGRESVREAPASSVFAREEYHSAIRGLGSAKNRLHGLSQPQFSSTPAVSSSNKSALVPEEEYLADDWLEDDLEEMQPKKKRRLRVEQSWMWGEDTASSSAARGQNTACRGNDCFVFLSFYFTPHDSLRILSLLCSSSLPGSAVSSSSSRNLSLKKNSSLKPHQVKMTQMPGMVRLGKREVNRSHSPTVTDDDDLRAETPPPPQIHVQVRSHPLF